MGRRLGDSWGNFVLCGSESNAWQARERWVTKCVCVCVCVRGDDVVLSHPARVEVRGCVQSEVLHRLRQLDRRPHVQNTLAWLACYLAWCGVEPVVVAEEETCRQHVSQQLAASRGDKLMTESDNTLHRAAKLCTSEIAFSCPEHRLAGGGEAASRRRR